MPSHDLTPIIQQHFFTVLTNFPEPLLQQSPTRKMCTLFNGLAILALENTDISTGQHMARKSPTTTKKEQNGATVGFEQKLWQGADPKSPDEYKAASIFWVPKEARWTHLKAIAPHPTIGTLAHKIELNRRREKTLGSMAQTLFKSCFVDGDIPSISSINYWDEITPWLSVVVTLGDTDILVIDTIKKITQARVETHLHKYFQ